MTSSSSSVSCSPSTFAFNSFFIQKWSTEKEKHTMLHDDLPLDLEYTAYQRNDSLWSPFVKVPFSLWFSIQLLQILFIVQQKRWKTSRSWFLIRSCMVFCIRCVFSIKFCYSAKWQQPAKGMRIKDDNENRICDTQNAKIIFDFFVSNTKLDGNSQYFAVFLWHLLFWCLRRLSSYITFSRLLFGGVSSQLYTYALYIARCYRSRYSVQCLY